MDLAHQKEGVALWCSWIQFSPFTGALSLSFFTKEELYLLRPLLWNLLHGKWTPYRRQPFFPYSLLIFHVAYLCKLTYRQEPDSSAHLDKRSRQHNVCSNSRWKCTSPKHFTVVIENSTANVCDLLFSYIRTWTTLGLVKEMFVRRRWLAKFDLSVKEWREVIRNP